MDKLGKMDTIGEMDRFGWLASFVCYAMELG